MEKEIEDSESQTLTLPDDLIFEHILPRLPVKPLTRFKSVSKSWLSTISNPKFAKTHLKLFTSPSPQFLLFSGNSDNHPIFTSITLDEHGRVEETFKFNFTFNGGPIHVLGCCNGLVCFFDKHYNFYICNPVTKQCSDVIDCPQTPRGHIVVITAAFAYVSSIDDYKIVYLLGLSGGIVVEDIDLYTIYIFSLRNNRWDRLSIDEIDGSSIVPADVPAFVNDTLYWPSVCHCVGVNLVNSELSRITIMYKDMMDAYKRCGGSDRLRLYGIKGRLSWCFGSHVWMLESDGVSWKKLYDLNRDGMKLLCVSETGKWLVLNRGEVALLDPSKPFDRQYQGGTSVGCPIVNAWNYKMSLVSPVLE
ncbi:putative F-box/kelch-repeat protein At1g12870 [Chenopodium quinoa]|uniref:F-box domain-containing protein n=1 Tax=Chenopodium quinoa TaxID=63459 RepID=A0A803LMX0_CHEQI|nr:putative F-box/kelch-repeat protein At1g12870 [Chenopodium quinoa]